MWERADNICPFILTDMMKRGVQIEDYLKPLQPNQTQCYLTNTLQVADIVEWTLAQIGKSTIWQTSFSISEEFLRRLYFISKSGNVETIHLLLDFSRILGFGELRKPCGFALALHQNSKPHRRPCACGLSSRRSLNILTLLTTTARLFLFGQP